MPTYNTPGVWVEEISTLAPSVAQVATAIPAFIGCTEKGYKPGGKVARIDTLLDYVNLFGEAQPSQFTATINNDEIAVIESNKDSSTHKFLMYYGLSLYFRNGGGTCYIVSIGDYNAAPDKSAFETGLALLEKEDEPTLIVLLDAVNLDKTNYYDLVQQALAQCHKLGDRFLILDVPTDQQDEASDIGAFRSGTGMQYLSYAAAYHPYLQTTLNYRYDDKGIQVLGIPPVPQWTSGANGITVTNLLDKDAKVKVLLGSGNTCTSELEGETKTLKITLPKTLPTGSQVVGSLTSLPAKFAIEVNGSGSATVNPFPSQWSSGEKGITVTYSGKEPAQVEITRGVKSSTEFTSDPTGKLSITLAANAKVWGDVFNAWELLPPKSKPADFAISRKGDGGAEINIPPSTPVGGENGISIINLTGAAAKVKIVAGTDTTLTFDNGILTITLGTTEGAKKASAVVSAWGVATDSIKNGFRITKSGSGDSELTATEIDLPPASLSAQLAVEPVPLQLQTLATLKTTDTGLFNRVKAELGKQRVVLPPSPALAGIYVQVDRDRGVWKAPANVSVASVVGPVSKISDDQQGTLNVDSTSGKSINAIRAFIGKGTLVWGARTLDGNSNEWRYVPVRRLFITIEESTRKASSFAVFEPNDATTWLKVKAMIDAYLYGLWEQGALAGSKPEQAYFVNVGLGKTMTAQDILEGRMIVEIGVAAVRPAEFIILRFSHKMQEA